MMWVAFKRVARAGVINVVRNSFVALASIFVITMTVMILGSLMFLSGLVDQFVGYLKDKVDVNVYFVTTADEGAILDLKRSLEQLPEVSYVAYITRDEALATFRDRHEDDQLTVQALDELGDNPFGASLSIKAREPSQYEGIAQYLRDVESNESPQIIETVNYAQNKVVIDQLSRVTTYVNRFGLIVTIVFAIASILITFNTIRLAIYTSREEISVMRLVGATNMYIRGPFVIEGTIYGLVASCIGLLLFFPITFLLRPATEAMFNADIFAYYLANFFWFILVLMVAGAALGAASSFLAVRKYLSV
ncbi:MAG: permease-like cell division protein FtsX [Patescibacteria group bacterium]